MSDSIYNQVEAADADYDYVETLSALLRAAYGAHNPTKRKTFQLD